MFKKLMMSTALSAALATAAFAQTPSSPRSSSDSPAAKSESASPSTAKPEASGKMNAGKINFVSSQEPDQWLTTKLTGTDVVGSDNEKRGDVSDILFDKSGKVEAFIVSVGGFLGVGAKEVALAPSSFDVISGQNGSSDKLKLSATKDQLKDAQEVARYEPPRPAPPAARTPAPR